MNIRRLGFAAWAGRWMRAAWVLGVMVASTVAHAESAWIADNQGCKHFDPNLHPNVSLQWSGACVDGFAEGYGVEEWTRDGSVSARFTGTMKQGQYVGSGSYWWANGNSYEGSFGDGRRNGHGIFRWVTGSTYEGDFVADKRSGHGIFHWANGNSYEGQVLDDKLNGHGVYRWAGGSVYEGDFVAGKKSGHGVWRGAKGGSYEGQFADDKQSGHGVLRQADGAILEGEFVNGAPSGRVQVQRADGLRFESEIPERSLTSIGAYPGTMVCTKMGKPTQPDLGGWTGEAVFRVTAVVRDGRVKTAETAVVKSPGNPAIQKLLIGAVIKTMAETYECPGDHTFVQTFVFRVGDDRLQALPGVKK